MAARSLPQAALIFVAVATDNLIPATDIRTGRTIWQDKLPAGGQATPMTYEVHGKQYIVSWPAAITSWKRRSELIAYALPSKPT